MKLCRLNGLGHKRRRQTLKALRRFAFAAVLTGLSTSAHAQTLPAWPPAEEARSIAAPQVGNRVLGVFGLSSRERSKTPAPVLTTGQIRGSRRLPSTGVAQARITSAAPTGAVTTCAATEPTEGGVRRVEGQGVRLAMAYEQGQTESSTPAPQPSLIDVGTPIPGVPTSSIPETLAETGEGETDQFQLSDQSREEAVNQPQPLRAIPPMPIPQTVESPSCEQDGGGVCPVPEPSAGGFRLTDTSVQTLPQGDQCSPCEESCADAGEQVQDLPRPEVVRQGTVISLGDATQAVPQMPLPPVPSMDEDMAEQSAAEPVGVSNAPLRLSLSDTENETPVAADYRLSDLGMHEVPAPTTSDSCASPESCKLPSEELEVAVTLSDQPVVELGALTGTVAPAESIRLSADEVHVEQPAAESRQPLAMPTADSLAGSLIEVGTELPHPPTEASPEVSETLSDIEPIPVDSTAETRLTTEHMLSPVEDRTRPARSTVPAALASRVTPAEPTAAAPLVQPGTVATWTVAQQDSTSIVTQASVLEYSVEHPSFCKLIKTGDKNLSLIGVQPGATRIAIVTTDGQGERVVQLHRVTVSPAEQAEFNPQRVAGELAQTIGSLYPQSQIEIVSVSGRLIVQGYSPSEDEARKILSFVRKTVLVPVTDRIQTYTK